MDLDEESARSDREANKPEILLQVTLRAQSFIFNELERNGLTINDMKAVISCLDSVNVNNQVYAVTVC